MGRHWSIGTPYEDVKHAHAANPYARVTAVDGLPVVTGPVAVKSGGRAGSDLATSAAADAILAQAKAAGWSAPTRRRGDEWCGDCAACLAGSRSGCRRRGSAEAAAKARLRETADRARLADLVDPVGAALREFADDDRYWFGRREAEAVPADRVVV